MYTRIFNDGIRIDYDHTIPYELRLFMYTKCNSYIDENIKRRNEYINTFENIINTNNDFSEYLHNSNMFDYNLINII